MQSKGFGAWHVVLHSCAPKCSEPLWRENRETLFVAAHLLPEDWRHLRPGDRAFPPQARWHYAMT